MTNKKVLGFPPYKLPDNLPFINRQILSKGVVYTQAGDNSLLGMGIYKDDWLAIDTLRAVGSGELAVIEFNQHRVLGIARFIGDGKLKIEYANENFKPVTYKLSKVIIVGRVVRIERDLI